MDFFQMLRRFNQFKKLRRRMDPFKPPRWRN
jgi:hypothetical protein